MPDRGLHVHVWGQGDRTALLLHGQFGDGLMWWEVAPGIAAAGYRVVSVDLPGHGRTPRNPDATVDSTIDEIIDLCPDPELAIGQSLGGLILAHGAHGLGVERAVFVDTPLRLPPSRPREETMQLLKDAKAQRTLSWLQEHRSHWSDRDRQIEADAAERFDVATSLSLVGSLRGMDHPPPSGIRSLAILPDPSEHVPSDDVAQLREAGVEVRQIPGAGHTVWYGHVPQFLDALDGWL
ncbi:MAG: alpha/beta hydrolase [bacterium]|nr:alpha/beta hydrolase [bacterium]